MRRYLLSCLFMATFSLGYATDAPEQPQDESSELAARGRDRKSLSRPPENFNNQGFKANNRPLENQNFNHYNYNNYNNAYLRNRPLDNQNVYIQQQPTYYPTTTTPDPYYYYNYYGYPPPQQ